MKHLHLGLTFVWAAILALAVLGLFSRHLAFLLGVAFVSLCSIYANMVGHWGAHQASRAEDAVKDA